VRGSADEKEKKAQREKRKKRERGNDDPDNAHNVKSASSGVLLTNEGQKEGERE